MIHRFTISRLLFVPFSRRYWLCRRCPSRLPEGRSRLAGMAQA